MKKRSIVLTLVLIWAIGTRIASAYLIGSDSFNTAAVSDLNNGIYQTGGDIQGSTVHGGTIVGFESHAWTGSSGLLDAHGTGLTVNAIEYASGGSIRYPGYGTGDSTIRYVRRTLDSYTTSSVYYVSVLIKIESLDVNGATYAGYHSGLPSDSEFYGILFGFEGNGSGMNLVVRQRQFLGSSTYGLTNTVLGAVSANTTYQFIAEITVNANGSEEAVKVWVNPTSVYDPPNAEFGASDGVYSMAANDSITGMSVSGQYLNEGNAVLFDEMRLGTEWNDVVPTSTISLLGSLSPERKPPQRMSKVQPQKTLI